MEGNLGRGMLGSPIGSCAEPGTQAWPWEPWARQGRGRDTASRPFCKSWHSDDLAGARADPPLGLLGQVALFSVGCLP